MADTYSAAHCVFQTTIASSSTSFYVSDMFTLTKIATFAALALSTLSTAVAVPAVETRQSDNTDVVGILDNPASSIKPVAAQLATLTADNATSDVITPIVNSITSEVSDAVNALSAIPTGTAINGDAIQSLANIFSAILTPTNTLIATTGVDAASIAPIFTQLGNTLAQLLQNVVRLVQEVLELVVQVLQGLITGLSGVISGLGIGALQDLGL